MTKAHLLEKAVSQIRIARHRHSEVQAIKGSGPVSWERRAGRDIDTTDVETEQLRADVKSWVATIRELRKRL